MSRVILIACAAGLGLAACGQTPPARKAGLWQETITRDGNPKMLGNRGSVGVCIGSHTDERDPIFNHDVAVKQGLAHGCQSPTASRKLDGSYVFASTCPLPNGAGITELSGSANGNFRTAYHLRIESTVAYNPPYQAIKSHHVDDVDGRYVGPCPPELKIGDMRLGNGQIAPGGHIPDPHHGMTRGRSGSPPSPQSPITKTD
jgi:hypothetical protein